MSVDNLDQGELEKIFDLSEQYADRLISKQKETYEVLLEKCDDPDKARKVLEEADKVIRQNRERKLERALERESYKFGLMPKDPYFLLCYKPISPMFYSLFHETGHRASEVENNDWKDSVMTNLIREESNGGYEDWLEEFKKRRDIYYASFPKEVRNKLSIRLRENNYEDVYKSHLVQYLKKIEKAVARVENDG